MKDKTNRVFTFNHHKESWTIKRTRHVYEIRKGSRYARDEFLNQSRYIDIFKHALNHGLTSFREKGNIVVNVVDYQGVFYSILCSLDIKNNITIISVFRTKSEWWKSFMKERNRINIMRGYIVPQMSMKERENKQHDKILNDIEIELETGQCSLKDYMSYLDVRAIS